MLLRQLFRSASFRLAALYVALFSASALILAAIIYVQTWSEFDRQARLRMEAEASALQAEFALGGETELLGAIKTRQRSKVSGGLDYTVYDAEGRRIIGGLADTPFKAGWSTALGPPDGDEPPGDLERLTVLTVALSDRLWLSIGDDLIRIEQFGDVILRTFAWVLALSVSFAILGGLIISALFLGRVRVITDTAEAIIGGDIHRRIPRRKAADELDRLAATLNQMLDRIVSLMDALRHVSNSIAHELRTPLAHLRQTLDAARASAAHGAPRSTIEQAIEEVEAVLSTFSALLRIAQIESGTRKQGLRDVDLSALVESIVQTFAAIAEDGGRSVRSDVATGVMVHGDHELLTQMLVNLIENAIRHTPKSTSIEVLLLNETRPRLIVADNGKGIPKAECKNVFKRFYRVDVSPLVSGSGLGLSMVAAAAELHDVAIDLSDNHPGLRCELVFPVFAGPGRDVAKPRGGVVVRTEALA